MQDEQSEAHQAERQTCGRKHLSGRSSPFVGMKSEPLATSLKTLERVKGIEPSYSAWNSTNFAMASKTVLTFFSVLVD
jgi:hypothetical protein